MANFVFDKMRDNMLGDGTRIDLDGDTIKGIFIDHGNDTPVVTDVFVSDLLSASRVPAFASCPTLGSKTIGSDDGLGVGIWDAADLVFSALSGASVESLVLFKNVTADTDSPLIVRWDTATGLPLTPNGADVTVVWAGGGILTV